MAEKHGGRILTFWQDPDFHIRNGDQKREAGDMAGALRSYWRAYENGGPHHEEACFAIAHALHDIWRFEESNRLLILFQDRAWFVPDFLYAEAENCFALMEFPDAYRKASEYLSIEPGGLFADAARMIVDCIEGKLPFPLFTGSDETDPEILAVSARAGRLIQQGEPETAERLLRKIAPRMPDEWYVQVVLSSSLSALGREEEAMSVLSDVLRKEPDNPIVRAEWIRHLIRGKDLETAREMLREVRTERFGGTGIAATYARLQADAGMTAEAEETLSAVIRENPFSREANHLYACLCRLRGREEDGRPRYMNLLAADPDDTVASYYLNEIGRKVKNPHTVWPFDYRVPLPEAARRIDRIERILSGNVEEETTERTDAILKWGLRIAGEPLRKKILRFIGARRDPQAESILREYLLLSGQPDFLKEAALEEMRERNAPPPYSVLLGGVFREGSEIGMELPASYQRALDRTLQHLNEDPVSAPAAEFAVRLIRRYVRAYRGVYPRLDRNQETAMAAALEEISRVAAGHKVDEEEILERYHLTAVRLHNAVDRLMPLAEAELGGLY